MLLKSECKVRRLCRPGTVLNPDTDKDFIDMAMLLASQTDYAITDANEVKEALSKELPNMTRNWRRNHQVSGDNSFEGSLVVDSQKTISTSDSFAGGTKCLITLYRKT